MSNLEPDGLLSVGNTDKSNSLSLQADILARQHPTTADDVRDFHVLTACYYDKLLADQFPKVAARRQR